MRLNLPGSVQAAPQARRKRYVSALSRGSLIAHFRPFPHPNAREVQDHVDQTVGDENRELNRLCLEKIRSLFLRDNISTPHMLDMMNIYEEPELNH
ncbi:MAG: hypothetical protein QHI48_05640 [Bacteroidota bacterium]|nr:hypothetical protein [Bacteroidota bacterium]